MIVMKKNLMVFAMNLCMVVGVPNLCVASSINDVPERVQPNQMKAPMVVEFYRPSCSHCQNMAPIYEAVAKQCTNGTNFYRINADNMSWANGLAQLITNNQLSHLTGVPTFVFVNKSGSTKCEVKTGGMTKAVLQSKVAQLQ